MNNNLHRTRVALAIPLLVSLLGKPLYSQQSDRNALPSIAPDARVHITLGGNEHLDGRFRSWSAEAIEISMGRRSQTLRLQDIARIQVLRPASRWKGALVGGVVGFGIAFVVGSRSAGYLTDRNNPSLASRFATGSGLGLFGAGIGAPIGALFPAARRVTVYGK